MEILNEDLTLLRDSARGYLAENHPVTVFRALRDTGRTSADAIASELAALGWMGILLPENLGGADFGCRAAGLIATELGHNLTAAPFLSTAILSATALRACGGEVLASWGCKMAAGEAIIALAMDEGAKHRPERIDTHLDGAEGGFILTGRKSMVVDGNAADRLIVTAKHDDELVLLWVDPSASGVFVTPQITLDMRDVALVQFDNVALGSEAILAKGTAAEAALSQTLMVGRSIVAAEQLGVAQAVADQTLAYLKTRTQFGIEIGRFQALQHRAAHLYGELEQSASLIAAALSAIDDGDDTAEALSRAAKAKTARTGQLAAEEGVQMHGGIGMTDEMDLGFFMKRDRALAETLGDAGVHTDWLLRARGL